MLILDLYTKKTKEQKLKTTDPRHCYHISAYRKTFIISASRKTIAQSILRLIEQWTSAFDNINFISEVLMNLSEAFDYISHDIFITKLHARSFSENSQLFLKICKSLLKTWKRHQNVQ